MLKKVVKYTNYDNEPAEATLYFHVTRSRLIENLDMEDELTEISSWFEGGQRELTRDEIKQIINMVKRIMSIAYGVRDGDIFDQSPELWEKFQKTAVYEAFLWSLFENPTEANEFMTGVLPSDLLAAAKAEAEKQGTVLELPSQ